MARAERTVELAPELTSVRTGRHFVRDVLIDWDLDQLVDDAQLAVSELVSNAVSHAGTTISVSIRADDELTVVVRDEAGTMPVSTQPTQAASDATSGRGLQIVEAVSDSWGVSAAAGGKSIWFTLRIPDHGARDAEIVSLDRRREALADAAADRLTSPAPDQARA